MQSIRTRQTRWALGIACAAVTLVIVACDSAGRTGIAELPAWEAENPISELASPPLGMQFYFEDAHVTPTPARVRLGRWLFFDTRLSSDNTVACATCHRPEHAFSEPTPVSTGIRGQKGTRKAPTFINQAVTIEPNFFWDGRAHSLEEQVLGPVANPIEMGNTHEAMVASLSKVQGYRPYFKEAFGTDEITKERVAQAIADYERTRMAGNAPYDKWRSQRDQSAVSTEAKLGYELFFDKAGCSSCHLGSNFTDSKFHNIGIGWNPKKKTFADEGRAAVTKDPRDRGAFKTPTLRELGKRAPYMHDGSVATLKEVVEFYNTHTGLDAVSRTIPGLDPRMLIREKLTPKEVDALVEFLKTLDNGQGYQDVAPKLFPQ